ncbi:MAG: hypothetical protein KY437_05460 [Actinobacteria bacterium]|nr:hypothetical protein [Actinomycetota bacterium]
MSRLRSLWPDLIRLGWPVSATLTVRVTMRTVDILVVGLVVGAPGVAALGIGDAAARIVLMTALGFGAGTIATVSQRIGAGRDVDADVAVTQSALLATVVGILASAGAGSPLHRSSACSERRNRSSTWGCATCGS